MNCPALAVIKARLTLSSNDTSMHKGLIMSYAGVVNHLLRRYCTEAIIAKTDEKIRSFKQGALIPWKFSEKLTDLTL